MVPEPSCASKQGQRGAEGGGPEEEAHSIRLVDHAPHLVPLGLEAHRPHRHFELVGINRARVVGVEELERLADLLALVGGEARHRRGGEGLRRRGVR